MFKSHGRLKPSNCVIDNKWTLKITGLLNVPILAMITVVLYCILIHYVSVDYGSRLFKGIPRSKSNDQDFAEEGILDTDLKT